MVEFLRPTRRHRRQRPPALPDQPASRGASLNVFKYRLTGRDPGRILDLEQVQIAMVSLQDVRIVRAPIERCFDLARSVEAHLAENVHSGDAAMAAAGVTAGLLRLGDQVTWRARHFGIRWSLTSEISAMRRPVSFQVVMIRGPFRFMLHDHFFRACLAARPSCATCFPSRRPSRFWGAWPK